MPSRTPSPTKLALVVGLVALLAVAVTVGLLATDGESDPPPVEENASERYAALDGLEATVETSVERDGATNRTVRRIALRPGTGQIRLSPVDDASRAETVVSNGSVKWSHDSETHLVSRTDASGFAKRLRTRGERIERLFERATDAADAETATDERTPGVSPLPVVPHAGPNTPDAPATNRSDDRFEVGYDGTATVADREVHVLRIRPREGANATVSQTLWIDAEHFVPLRYRTEWVEDGEPVETTVRYRDVQFDPGLTDDTFEYEVPANAALVTPDLGANAADRIRSIDGLAATIEMNYTGLSGNGTDGSEGSNLTDDGGMHLVQRMQTVPGTGKYRTEVVSAPFLEETTGTDLTVSNGSVAWTYDADANEATRLGRGGTVDDERRFEGIEQLFARLNRTRAASDGGGGATPTPGLAPIPGVGVAGSAGPSGIPAGAYGVSLDRAERVEGRMTYVLAIRPEPSAADPESGFENYSRTLWIDAETYFPVKQRTAFGSGANRTTSVVTYRNLTYTDGFPDGTFAFEPPANATVTENTAVNTERYESRAATAANASVETPDPTVPPDFEFDGGRVMQTESLDSVALVYRNETSRIRVVVQSVGEASAGENATLNGSDAGREIRLGNRTASYTRSGLYRSVTWRCDGLRYSVNGQLVSKPLLVEIAGSIACS